MKNRALILLALSASFAAGLIVGESKQETSPVPVDLSRTTDAAFRDGLYQARLDLADGRKPHPAIGRWNSVEARVSFLAGYRSGYQSSSEAPLGRSAGPSVAELAAAGYRDGMLDGSWHKAASQPFQAEQTTNYQVAGGDYLGVTTTPEEFRRFYRESYMNGYRHAYFAQPEPQAETSGH
jgi:hypothetical protein